MKIGLAPILGLLSVLFVSAAFAQQEELLPSDAPVVATVVHGVKYPLAGKLGLDLDFVRYYEDRLASTWGVGVEPKYFVSEKLYVALPTFIFISKPVTNAQFSNDGSQQIVAVDPAYGTGLVAGYNAIYGKFALGNSITHFRAGINGGFSLMQLHYVSPPSSSQMSNSLAPGVQLGLQMTLQLGENWLLNAFSTAHVHQAAQFAQESANSIRLGWLYGLSIGRTL